jgi:hypothetical protein
MTKLYTWRWGGWEISLTVNASLEINPDVNCYEGQFRTKPNSTTKTTRALYDPLHKTIGDGESQNVSGRLASHRSLLNRKFIPIICCKLTITNMKSTVLSILYFHGTKVGTIHYSKERT